MKLLFDFFPLILFLITFKSFEDPLQGLLVATAVTIAATMVQVGYMWFKHHHVEKMHIITLVLIIVFGGLTLWFADPLFLKWKVTLVNWLFSLVFFGSQFIGKKNLLKRMLTNKIILPDNIWLRLNMAWSLFFVSIGCANLYVAFNYSLNIWVNFKTYGVIGLTLVFVIAQAIYMAKFISEKQKQERVEE